MDGNKYIVVSLQSPHAPQLNWRIQTDSVLEGTSKGLFLLSLLGDCHRIGQHKAADGHR